jgi:coenzyme F420-reducing hydrogenase delta subunit/Pyruvate/2-oxoacid:ferredoxin oxidoreductase delta subunit
LAAEIGEGEAGHRRARAVAALARAAGQLSLAVPSAEETVPIAQTVLVVGAGTAALAAAAQATRLGHSVVLATPLDSPELGGVDDDPAELVRLAAELPAGVQTLTRTGLAGLTGAAGDFTVTLQGLQGRTRIACGAVVLAPPAVWRAEPVPAGLDTALCLPLSSLEPASQSGGGERWLQVVLLAGTERSLSAAAFARAMAAGLALARRPCTQVTFLFGEARVAAEGSERLYRELRQAGALMARVEPGGLKAVEEGRALAWFDPLLGEEVSLAPDLVAVAEEAVADLPAFLTEAPIGTRGEPVSWPAWKELTPEWPRLRGGLTARSGLYILGAARGTAAGDARLAEAAVAVGEAHERLASPAAAPRVRLDHCAHCLTCVRACPHGVPRHEDGRIVCAPVACLQCGLCAAVCPALAIAPAGWSQEELAAGLAAGLARTPGPALVLAACARSAMAACAQLAVHGWVWPVNLLLLPVPCVSRVGAQLQLKALELGAAGVLLASCHQGNCRSLKGGDFAAAAAAALEPDLLALGFSAGVIRSAPLAGNQAHALAEAVEIMLASLKD